MLAGFAEEGGGGVRCGGVHLLAGPATQVLGAERLGSRGDRRRPREGIQLELDRSIYAQKFWSVLLVWVLYNVKRYFHRYIIHTMKAVIKAYT